MGRGEPARVHSITYYDFSNFAYLGYFLHGFAENSEAFGYRFGISARLNERAPAKFPDYSASAGLFSFDREGREALFCIDTSDSAKLFYLPLVECCEFYFKVNYRRSAVMADARLTPHRAKILPASPFFPLAPLPAARVRLLWGALRRASGGLRAARERRAVLAEMPSLRRLRALRGRPKEIDVFCVLNHYGEAIHAAADLQRSRLIREIRLQPGLNAIAGLTHPTPLRNELADLQVGRYGLAAYLAQLARSRVALYLRGVHDCISFKYGQFHALGLPIVGQPLFSEPDLSAGLAGHAEQFAFEEPSALVARARELLERPGELRELAALNAEFFERELAPQAATRRLLAHLLREPGASMRDPGGAGTWPGPGPGGAMPPAPLNI